MDSRKGKTTRDDGHEIALDPFSSRLGPYFWICIIFTFSVDDLQDTHLLRLKRHIFPPSFSRRSSRPLIEGLARGNTTFFVHLIHSSCWASSHCTILFLETSRFRGRGGLFLQHFSQQIDTGCPAGEGWNVRLDLCIYCWIQFWMRTRVGRGIEDGGKKKYQKVWYSTKERGRERCISLS